jgi:hypothetical protein
MCSPSASWEAVFTQIFNELTREVDDAEVSSDRAKRARGCHNGLSPPSNPPLLP